MTDLRLAPEGAKPARHSDQRLFEPLEPFRPTGHGTQTVDLARVFTDHKVVLRVEIRRDTYPSQSFARVSLFDGQRWNPLYDLVHARMVSKDENPYGLNPDQKADMNIALMREQDGLLRMAAAILDHHNPAVSA